MVSRVNRGEVWVAHVGRKRRPVLVLTRSEVIDVRELVTVAEVSTSIRGLAVEVALDHEDLGLTHASVVNCDGIHTIAQSVLTEQVGVVAEMTMKRVCRAINLALGC